MSNNLVIIVETLIFEEGVSVDILNFEIPEHI